VRIAFSAAVERLARHVVAAGSTDWIKTVKAAVRELSPPMRAEIAAANEHTFQTALVNAMLALKAGST
jgi:hypothetical protein